MITQSYSFSRVANTTQYAQNELVGNSATAADVEPMSWSLKRLGGSGTIKGVRLYKSQNTTTAAIFDVFLFTGDPGTPTNGDNGAFGIASAVAALAKVSIDMSSGAIAGGTTGCFKRSADLNIGVDVANLSGVLYGLLSTGTSGTYTPASGETFTVTLEIDHER